VGPEKQSFNMTGGYLWLRSLFNAHYEYVLSVTGALPVTKGDLCPLPKLVFHVVLVGAKVIDFTDHATLKFLLTKKDAKPILM
jgi:hypothetical protein